MKTRSAAMKTRSAAMKTRSAMKNSISSRTLSKNPPKKSRKSVVAEKQLLLSLLPVEIIWKILEYTDYDTFLAVTGDHVRADTILLSQGQFKKYFETRPFDYCPNRDYRLAEYSKQQDCAIRLPLLADGLFQTYVKTQPDDYDIAKDTLLQSFLGVKDTTNLSLLIDGNFYEYQQVMQEKEKGAYDVTKDTLLMRYLGTNADNIVECFDYLTEFDWFFRGVETVNHTAAKLLAIRRMRTTCFYKFLKLKNVSVPECLLPMNVAKVLIKYSQLFETEALYLSKGCAQCFEPAIPRETGEKFLQTSDWENLYVILFCCNCAYCLLKLPFESDSDSD
ncbi:LEF-7 [Spodoptera cosmioides nucleopolyhedrovirus]|uniref:LEF-7 n=1 Tax=Spodoptera cosmioides nucleopolyhedrovirus TaxID=2605774 RepID=A0A6B7KKT8_9ABAC|nr:LEF-7 [Spodoptera cosmioides nucleopolyhedrovirus]